MGALSPQRRPPPHWIREALQERMGSEWTLRGAIVDAPHMLWDVLVRRLGMEDALPAGYGQFLDPSAQTCLIRVQTCIFAQTHTDTKSMYI